MRIEATMQHPVFMAFYMNHLDPEEYSALRRWSIWLAVRLRRAGSARIRDRRVAVPLIDAVSSRIQRERIVNLLPFS
jgi:hypothetical protein